MEETQRQGTERCTAPDLVAVAALEGGRIAGGVGLRPGPTSTPYSPGMAGIALPTPFAPVGLEREVEIITRALEESGPLERAELARRVGARFWGPGRFREAIRQALAEGRIARPTRRTLGPAKVRSQSPG